MTIEENVPLKYLNTMKVGGDAKYFCVAKSLEDIEEAVSFAKEMNLPIFALGGGSNVLISDEGFPGLVIKIAVRGIEFEDFDNYVKVKAGAGEHWDYLVKDVVKQKLWGLENLSGIPGTVGGAPVQNIGAYGSEVGPYVDSIDIYDIKEGKTRKLFNEQCRFAYRYSLFKTPGGKNYIIVSVTFKLSKTGSPNISYKDLTNFFTEKNILRPSLTEIREAVLKIRADKFPPLDKFGTAGSFFKNPLVEEDVFNLVKSNFPAIPNFPGEKGLIKLPLAWIMDKVCNLRGQKMGHVCLYEKQPIVLVNLGNATSHEIEIFSDKIIHDVKEKSGLSIEREVEMIGEDNPPKAYQGLFWSIVYTVMPKITAIIQATGYHNFRQNYKIGFLKKDKIFEEVVKHLHRKGYSKAYMAWKDKGEVYSLRKIVHKKFQYHIRIFKDGEIRGHYEYTPEKNPVGHLWEVVFTNPKEYFEHLLHLFLEKK